VISFCGIMGKEVTMSKLNPWEGWRPPTREYDPNDPHFDPFHPPKNTPDEVLKAFWGDDDEDDDEDKQSEA